MSKVNSQSRAPQSHPHSGKQIWAIGGGKGGIGKTLLVANMAVYLGWLKKKIVVVDMDIGGANLHTSLGVEPPTHSLSDLLLEKVKNINDLVSPTPVKNVHLINGASDPTGIVNMRHIHKTQLMRKFRQLEADVVILDLGAGTALDTIEFFLIADKKILVSTPEPTSIENCYRFLKSAFYHELRSATPSPHARQLIEQSMNENQKNKIRTPKQLLAEVIRLSPAEGRVLEKQMSSFEITLVLNQVRTRAEEEVGPSIQVVCERYFGMNVDYAGYLPYDNSVWQSARRRVPVLIGDPNSTITTHLEAILRHLMKAEK